jgi:hypothetical protein
MPELVEAFDPVPQRQGRQAPGELRITEGDEHSETEQPVAVQVDEVCRPGLRAHVTDGTGAPFELQQSPGSTNLAPALDNGLESAADP